MRKTTDNKFDMIMFIYVLIGLICALLLLLFNGSIYIFAVGAILMFYIATFPYICLSYLIIDCFFTKHNSIIMNIIDTVLGLILFGLYPLFYKDMNKSITTICLAFPFLPLIFDYIDYKQITRKSILKTVTRILMMVIIFIIISSLKSCSAGSLG